MKYIRCTGSWSWNGSLKLIHETFHMLDSDYSISVCFLLEATFSGLHRGKAGKADDLYCGSMQFVNHRRTALQLDPMPLPTIRRF